MQLPPSTPSSFPQPPPPSLPSVSPFFLALLGLSLSRHAATQELKPPLCVGSEGLVGGSSANDNAEQSGIQSGQLLAVMPPATPVSAPRPPHTGGAAPTVWSLRRRLCFVLSTHFVPIYAPHSLHIGLPFLWLSQPLFFLPRLHKAEEKKHPQTDRKAGLRLVQRRFILNSRPKRH